MSDRDLLQEAVAELYSADPEEFTGRREVLAAGARAAGQPAAAKRITGLRKPTRSAWIVNRLARSDPGLVSQLAPLGAELRAAQRSVDGTKLRELSERRRTLVDTLARRAFTASGQRQPPAALRDEVIATFGAALADPEVADQVAAGNLVRAVRREGFGPAADRVLTVVPPPQAEPAPRREPPSRREPASGSVSRPRARSEAAAERAARARAVRERHTKALAKAEQKVADAEAGLAAAASEEQDRQRAVRLIEEQLADARQRLDDARQGVRRAERAVRGARQDLDRLRSQPLSIG